MAEPDSFDAIARGLVRELSAAGKTVSTAESCTGGWIAKALTDVAGSSACFGYGIVSYSNGAKESLLGVSPQTLRQHGAVSEAAVKEMATGALNLSGADFAIAVSGIAGPDGGSTEKPVGTVWLAWACRRKRQCEVEAACHCLEGNRAAVRSRSVELALEGLSERLARG